MENYLSKDKMTDETIDLSGAEPQTLEFEPPVFREDVTVELVDMMGDENSIVRRARASTSGAKSLVNAPGSDLSKADLGLLKALYHDGHGTPFEGVEFEFYFEIPIFVSRQIVKHRLTSINEESGRYRELEGVFYRVPLSPSKRMIVQEGKARDYHFIPASDEIQKATRDVQTMMGEAAWQNYKGLKFLNVSNEVARMHLPLTLYSSMYYKTNLRSLLNFISLRKEWEGAENPSHAQYEIALVADKLAGIVQESLPEVWTLFVDSGYKAL